MTEPVQNSGSRWHRWDPHLHAPGTLHNDQFGGLKSWDEYLEILEQSDPPVRALGVTDYYLTGSYEQVIAAQKAGRISRCELIFPNIEMRLETATKSSRSVNIHLLVSPEDPDHLGELDRFLRRLEFPAHGEVFTCHKDDLVKLGRKEDPQCGNPLKLGAERFKVNFNGLRKAYQESEWAKRNILIAVAGGGNDGTAGLHEASDTTLREEMEKFAHIIFSSNAKSREFWIGNGKKTAEEIAKRFGSLKPCLHGCDAHDLGKVASPDGNRYSWVKGSLDFDSLRQACIDPAGRAFVGEHPPMSAAPSKTITHIEIQDAPWATTPRLALNPGLVCIIGARGSGKTALADMIATGCDAIEFPLAENDASFLSRASPLLGDAAVVLKWGDNEETSRALNGSDRWADITEQQRARYLSQKFVEGLCSAHGMTDPLLREIERVIFDAHSSSETDGTMNFEELRDLRTQRLQVARKRDEQGIVDLSDQISAELDKHSTIGALKKAVAAKEELIKKTTADREKLPLKGSDERAKQYTALKDAAEVVRKKMNFFTKKEQSLLGLQDEVANTRNYQAPSTLRDSQARHKEAYLSEDQWKEFLLGYVGDVDDVLATSLTEAKKSAAGWKGAPPALLADPEKSYLHQNTALEEHALAVLEAEAKRLEKLIGGDQQSLKRFQDFTKTITTENANLQKLKEELEDALEAMTRAKKFGAEVIEAYGRVFKSINDEERVLSELYAPLMAKLKGAKGTLAKLQFTVTRKVALKHWAKEGEDMIDRRLQGAFRGREALLRAAEKHLQKVWESGTEAQVQAAIAAFRETYEKDMLVQAKTIEPGSYRKWLRDYAKWLFGTSHIRIEYSISYANTDVQKLSPGTRGIALLLLYLALDDTDERPLIIDQPEENLDPQSIFDELVDLFTRAKTKRQVIMVTHNANLVVNTDADQIIIAEVSTATPGRLPPITYTSGGLENQQIRTTVCKILEGGEPAFKERARRLRVRLDR